MQVTCAVLIVIVFIVAFLFVALFRVGNLSRIKFVLKFMPVTLTFEASAASKLGELPPGEDEPEDTAPVGKGKRQGRSHRKLRQPGALGGRPRSS